MGLRPIKLPGDFKALGELIGEEFQYPEHRQLAYPLESYLMHKVAK